MTARTLAALALATLVAGACSSGVDDPEVLGVLVERSEAAATEVDATEPESRGAVREAPVVRDRADVTAESDQDTAEAAEQPVREPQPATTSPASQPDATTAEPVGLADGPGSTYTWSQPPDPPEEGQWWVEASSLPAQDRDADPWNAARVAARDVERAQDRDTGAEPVRRATCEAWLEAPADRPAHGTGTVTVQLQVNDATVATGTHRFDGTIAAGDRRSFEPVGDVTVDARDGDEVTCSVRFDSD